MNVADNMTAETTLLLTVVSLMVKLHAEEETVRKCLQRIVALLQMIVIPEMGKAEERLQEFLEEAKCQVCMYVREILLNSLYTFAKGHTQNPQPTALI